MSRSLRDLLNLSAPLVLSAALLSGCGSGGGGSADLDEGGSTNQPPPPVTVTETFDFASAADWFVVGTPPIHARFSGGRASDNGAGSWIIPAGATGVVDFGTPADKVRFSTEDDFTAASGAGAQKTRGPQPRESVAPPFGDQDVFIRGLASDWTANPARKLVEVSNNVLEVTLPLTTAIVANGEFEAADEPGEFKIAASDWSALNCGAGDAGARINVGQTYTMSCGANPGNLDLTIAENADYKFRLVVAGTGDTAPQLTITKVVPDGGGGGEEPPEDSTIIRIHSVTVVASAAGPAGVASVKEVRGLGSLSVDELRLGGDARITRIEIENTGTNGDIGVADFSWTADARFALDTEQVDMYYLLPEGSAAGMTIVVDGTTYDCEPAPEGSPYSCVARDVEVTPYANDTMAVRNADGSTRDTIIFNSGSGDDDVFAYSGSTYATTGSAPPAPPAIVNAEAHWVTADTLLYNPPAGTASVELLYSPNASIASGPDGFTGTFHTITLTSTTNPKPPFNNLLHSHQAWSLGAAAANAKDIARGKLVTVARDARGAVLRATYVQAAGAIDDLYADEAKDEPLGVSYESGVPSLAVWAPTALTAPGLSVNIYDADGTKLATEPMELDETTGIWRVTGTADWDRKFYTISLSVYSPHFASNAIVENEVTDPYSISLATDSVRSQFVNLDDPDLKPEDWDALEQPALEAPEDAVIYELHVRDFSIADTSVPVADRGKFTAFDATNGLALTDGRAHLRQLQQAGLTHVHILPAYDIATVKENPADRVELSDPVEDLCAAVAAAANLCVTDAGKTIRRAIEDSIAAGRLDLPQQIAGWMNAIDGFNWGYDPYHFGVPEGSYSTEPNGAARIREFRRMVKGLNELGLRTVLDVVYNHTTGDSGGQGPRSVFDKLVPGYYYRRDIRTGGFTGGFGPATAAEFAMMEKLMIDTGVTWVREYKVSGFRFDIMSLHPLGTMVRFKDAVTAIEPAMYIYGEGWSGQGADDRFTTASQPNLGGTGLGSFSDRIRDPVRGSVYDDNGITNVKRQGFINGWYYDPNSENTGSVAERQALIKDTDNIRVWLAGGLEDYQLQNSVGSTVTGAAVLYGGAPSGYTEDPQEAINYVEKHDNQTLWDYSAYKHPDGTSLADRVRAHNVGQSIILLAQGVPFLHAGTDILRSKSGDRDSYNSGDWFNEIDWTLSGTKWAQGLPVAEKNAGEWPILEGKYQTVPRPDGAAEQRAFDHVREMLRIRKSSPLFRLREAEQVKLRVKFLNTGPSQIPGVIAMEIDGCTEPGQPVPDKGAYLSIFNASDEAVTLPLFGAEAWTLHPVLVGSTDPIVRTATHDGNGFHVPARTTAVYSRVTQRSCAPYPVDMFVRGSFNDWGNNAATLPDYKLEFLGGKAYGLSAAAVTPQAAGLPKFKIADANWVAATNCGGTAAGQTVWLGQPFTMHCADGTPDLSLGAPVAGNYTFSLDATSTVNPVLTVTRTSPSNDQTVFLRGLFEDWGTSRPMAWDGESVYSARVLTLVPSTTVFKIATADWSTLNCGGPPGATASVTIGQPFALSCGDGTTNLGVALQANVNYMFAVDASNQAALTLTVEPWPAIDPFVRGLGGDWSDGDQNRMNYLGLGIYSVDKVFTPGDSFKIATSDWATVNCGWNGAGQQVPIGTPFAMACPGSDNLTLAPTAAGTYRFRYNATDGSLLVTGP